MQIGREKEGGIKKRPPHMQGTIMADCAASSAINIMKHGNVC